MQERDIIVAAFACGGKMNCETEAALFAEPPVILNVPGGSQIGFQNTADKYKKNNSILDNFFKDKLKDVKPRRVCLVSFSAGWAWPTEVLRTGDVNKIDTVMVMDGIHTTNLECWFKYADLALSGATRLFMAHTQIKPPFISTKETNTRIIDYVREKATKGQTLITIPEYVWDVKLDSPISVYSDIENPKVKVYNKDPLEVFEAVGNVARFEYAGNRAQDHIYNAQYVQPRFWHWLRDIWKDEVIHGVSFCSS